MASLVVAVVLLLPHIFHSEAANPEVNMPDIVDLGQIASLKGSNFAPHSQVIIAIDTQPSIAQKSSTAERPESKWQHIGHTPTVHDATAYATHAIGTRIYDRACG